MKKIVAIFSALLLTTGMTEIGCTYEELKKLFNFTNNGKRNTLRKILMLPMKHNITYGIVKIDTKETINLYQ